VVALLGMPPDSGMARLATDVSLQVAWRWAGNGALLGRGERLGGAQQCRLGARGTCDRAKADA